MKYLMDSFSDDEQNDLADLDGELEACAELRLKMLEDIADKMAKEGKMAKEDKNDDQTTQK